MFLLHWKCSLPNTPTAHDGNVVSRHGLTTSARQRSDQNNEYIFVLITLGLKYKPVPHQHHNKYCRSASGIQTGTPGKPFSRLREENGRFLSRITGVIKQRWESEAISHEENTPGSWVLLINYLSLTLRSSYVSCISWMLTA